MTINKAAPYVDMAQRLAAVEFSIGLLDSDLHGGRPSAVIAHLPNSDKARRARESREPNDVFLVVGSGLGNFY